MKNTKNLVDFGGRALEAKTQNDEEIFFDNTDAFSCAIDALRKVGGGILTVGKGIWQTGPIQLYSNITLELDDDCIISFIPQPQKYKPVLTRWEGVVCYAMQSCIFADNATNVTITGNGIVDGSGQTWWNLLQEKKKQSGPVDDYEKKLALLNPGYEQHPSGGGGRHTQFLRPALVQFHKCTNVEVSNVLLRNSPFWTLHPIFCEQVLFKNVRIENPADAPNTDGIDIDSCKEVFVDSCKVSVGDDAIAIKSGSGEDGIRVGFPSSYITVQNCVVSKGHGGIVIGSETAAGINHISVDNCLFEGTDRGIRIKTRRHRGGEIHHLKFKNLTMKDNLCPIAINMFYRCGSAGTEPELFSLEQLPVENSTPCIKDIEISDIHASSCKSSAGFIVGLPEMPIQNLHIKDSTFETDEESAVSTSESEMYAGISDSPTKSFRVVFAEDPVFENIKIKGPKEPFIFN